MTIAYFFVSLTTMACARVDEFASQHVNLSLSQRLLHQVTKPEIAGVPVTEATCCDCTVMRTTACSQLRVSIERWDPPELYTQLYMLLR